MEGSLWKALSLLFAALKAESSRSDFYLCQGRGPERTKTSPKIAQGAHSRQGTGPSNPQLFHYPSCSGLLALDREGPWCPLRLPHLGHRTGRW